MEKKPKLISLVATTAVCLVIIFSCKNGEKSVNSESSAESAMTESATRDTAQVTAAAARKFVRTANLKFLTKNVQKTTSIIEKTVHGVGGYIAISDLKTNIVEKTETKISQDSLLESTKYLMSNNMSIRIPNQKLDIIIDSIESQISFLDSRHISQDDVSLQLLSNKLSQIRDENQKKQIENAVASKGKKLNQIENAIQSAATIAENNDNSNLKNISLQDQINYSTINIDMYQREQINQIVLVNPENIASYEPHIGIQIWESIETGWQVLEFIILSIIKLWGIIALAFLAFFLYQRRATLRSLKT